MDILRGRNVEEKGIPIGIHLVEDTLLIIGEIVTVQVVVDSEAVVFVRRGSVASSDLLQFLVN